MLHWFALYYVPPAESEFYRLGSALLGYDVRAGRRLEPAPTLLETLRPIPDAWVKKARGFGFHLTVTEAMTYALERLSKIEAEVDAILRSFDPQSEMVLRLEGLRRWRGEQVWVLKYVPSRALHVLHAVLAARLSLLGQSSMFFGEIEEHPELYSAPFERQQLETFLSPRALDSWHAHFTLLNPHPSQADPALVEAFTNVFEKFDRLEPASFCLVLKEGDAPWRLYREYPWPPRERP